jgi:hypothetical protein
MHIVNDHPLVAAVSGRQLVGTLGAQASCGGP